MVNVLSTSREKKTLTKTTNLQIKVALSRLRRLLFYINFKNCRNIIDNLCKMWQNTEKEQREEITMEKEILYVRDLVQMFGVTRQAVDVWCRKGWIKYNQLGSGRRWFDKEEVEKFKNGYRAK